MEVKKKLGTIQKLVMGAKTHCESQFAMFFLHSLIAYNKRCVGSTSTINTSLFVWFFAVSQAS